METIDMTVSTNYVSDWSTWEGVRELIQNALDREREDGGNDATSADILGRHLSRTRARIKYYPRRRLLLVSNSNTTLARHSLMLGEGTKRTRRESIGQHGEGYKLAMLALVRSGHNVVVYNGRETWRPALRYSETFAAEVLSVDMENEHRNSDDLTFAVFGVTPDHMKLIRDRVRRLQEPTAELEGNGARILTDESQMGRIYVGGLYVTTANERFLYGYDFRPERLSLDRDRSTVDSFDLMWETARAVAGLGEEYVDEIYAAMDKDVKEAQYLLSHVNRAVIKAERKAYEHFRETYGDTAFPVSSEDESRSMRRKYKHITPVFVGQTLCNAIQATEEFRDWLTGVDTIKQESPSEVLRGFYEKYRDYFPQNLADWYKAEVVDRSESERWAKLG